MGVTARRRLYGWAPWRLLDDLAFDVTCNKRWGSESEVTDIRRRADVLGVAGESSLLLASVCLVKVEK